jgi:peptidoglycan/xylan/chitin deacetylase (PgdA/CDA1 family)
VADLNCALVYHDVVAERDRDTVGFGGNVAGIYKLTPERFEAHLDALAATGLRFGLGEVGTQAMLTFDDGGGSSLWVAAELERRGWRGAFFIITSRIGTPGFLDAAGVRELHARGHEVGSHSHTHPSYMGRLSSTALAEEWNLSRTVLAELLGSPPRSAAVPGGSVSAAVVEQAVRAGYQRLFTSTPGTRAREHTGMRVLGRYTIWANDTPELAAALASGAFVARARRWLGWQIKSAAKRLSPAVYEAMRSVRAGRRASQPQDDSI